MAEYIEREAIMEFPIRKDHCDKERANEHFIFGIESVLEYVENLPAADVAPVVRCENCRYAMWVEWAKKYSCGQGRGLLVFGDHFCAFGKREYESRPQASL